MNVRKHSSHLSQGCNKHKMQRRHHNVPSSSQTGNMVLSNYSSTVVQFRGTCSFECFYFYFDCTTSHMAICFLLHCSQWWTVKYLSTILRYWYLSIYTTLYFHSIHFRGKYCGFYYIYLTALVVFKMKNLHCG